MFGSQPLQFFGGIQFSLIIPYPKCFEHWDSDIIILVYYDIIWLWYIMLISSMYIIVSVRLTVSPNPTHHVFFRGQNMCLPAVHCHGMPLISGAKERCPNHSLRLLLRPSVPCLRFGCVHGIPWLWSQNWSHSQCEQLFEIQRFKYKGKWGVTVNGTECGFP